MFRGWYPYQFPQYVSYRHDCQGSQLLNCNSLYNPFQNTAKCSVNIRESLVSKPMDPIDQELISIILELKYTPLLQRYTFGKKNRGDIENHPYLKTLQEEYGKVIHQLNRLFPSLKVRHVYDILVSGMSLIMNKKDIEQLQKLPFVKKIHLNEKMTAVNNQHNMDSIQIPSARKMLNFEGQSLTGRGVTLAVIDTGIDRERLTGEANIIEAYNFVDDTQNIVRTSNHGTAVTNIILDVAPNVGLLGYKAGIELTELGDPNQWKISFDTDDVLKALEKSIAKKVDIINLSIGYFGPECILVQAVRAAGKEGIIVVAGAGNTSLTWNTSTIGSVPLAICVGATDVTGEKVASYSSCGPVPATWEIKPDVVAPGTYEFLGKRSHGTSYATPYVSGAIALMQQAQERTPEEVKSMLATTATRLTENGLPISPICQGSGRIDVLRAIQTTTLFSPIHVSFEPINLVSSARRKQVRLVSIQNTSNSMKTYHIAWKWDMPSESLHGEIEYPLVTLRPQEMIQVPLFLTAYETAREGLYPGQIMVTSADGEVWNIPILAMVELAGYPCWRVLRKPTAQEFIFEVFFPETTIEMDIRLDGETIVKKRFKEDPGGHTISPINMIRQSSIFVQPGTYTINVTGCIKPTSVGYLVFKNDPDVYEIEVL